MVKNEMRTALPARRREQGSRGDKKIRQKAND